MRSELSFLICPVVPYTLKNRYLLLSETLFSYFIYQRNILLHIYSLYRGLFTAKIDRGTEIRVQTRAVY